MSTPTIIRLSALALIAAAPLSAQEAEQLDEIIVSASRAALPARAVGSAVTVVDSEEIERQQAQRVSEILTRIPGVQVTTTRPGAFTSISLRGSDNNQVLVLLDGVRLGDPSSTSTAYQFDHLTSLDIERIEVLRGNQSSLYGSDAIGGVINIITKRAPKNGLLVQGEVETGSYGTLSGGVSFLGRTDIVDARLTLFGKRFDGPNMTDPATATRPTEEKDGYAARGVSGRAGIALSQSLSLDVTGFYSVTDLDYDSPPDDGFDSVGKDEYALGAQLTHISFDGRLMQEFSAGLYNAERAYETSFSKPGGDIYDGTLSRFGYTATGRPLDWLTVVGGLSYEREKTHQSTNFSGDFDASNSTRSVFGELAIEPLEGFTLTAAGRLDDNRQFGQFRTYRLTGAYLIALADGLDLKLRGSFGTGAKAPGLYQLYDPSYGNPNLKPQKSRGWDAGFDLYWGRADLTFDATYFRNHVEDKISWRSSGYYMEGETEEQGVEIGFTAAPHPWLQLRSNYTFLISQDGLKGSWRGRRRHSGAVSLTVSPDEDWSITARARYGTKSRDFGGETDPHIAFDLLGSYQLNDKIELYGRVENVLDADYQTYYGRSTPGISAYAGLRFAFGAE